VSLARIEELGDELYVALKTRTTVTPLSEREPSITIQDAYQISLRLRDCRLADGDQIIGKKIGVTSEAVQNALGVHQPDFGWLLQSMKYENGSELPISSALIQPRAEGEIAFVLRRDLMGPGIKPADVLAATDHVLPCFEVVDSRIHDWKIKIQDTVADNASSGLFVLGGEAADPRTIDFIGCTIVVEKNGAFLSTGQGAAALGSPLRSVAWLANTLGEFGVALRAGEVVLSGSLVPLEPVQPGDKMRLYIDGIGSAEVKFA
jgi:2-oxopent-4-enoate/cis-2-oxohex-4-enoate hydratase